MRLKHVFSVKCYWPLFLCKACAIVHKHHKYMTSYWQFDPQAETHSDLLPWLTIFLMQRISRTCNHWLSAWCSWVVSEPTTVSMVVELEASELTFSASYLCRRLAGTGPTDRCLLRHLQQCKAQFLSAGTVTSSPKARQGTSNISFVQPGRDSLRCT